MLTVSHPSSPMMAPSPGRSPSARTKRDRERAAAPHHSSPLQTFSSNSVAPPKKAASTASSSSISSTSSEQSASAADDAELRGRRMSLDLPGSRTTSLPTEDEQPHNNAVAEPSGVPSKPNLEPQVVVKRPEPNTPSTQSTADDSESGSGPAKRLRPPETAVKILPAKYEECDVKDLVAIISNMLMELIRFNDGIPLQDGQLTRFHSRAPPGISVRDYLQRIATHVTLSPPILLAMVYYIDKLCLLYPAFTISSLTVHRFLIAAATVAAKGLSDSFWTNSTYARVGGVSLKELALLELEFLWRVQWRIVPKPEVLVDYYRSLVARCDGYELEKEDAQDAQAEEAKQDASMAS